MFVAVNGVRLFVDVLSPALAPTPEGVSEKPTLLCLHGGPGGDHMGLRPEIDRLAEHAQVILFDQRGGGRGEAGPPGCWTLDQWADDVVGFCEVLGVERPIVFGFSGGCMVALRYAARHPGHPAALILASPVLRFDREALVARFTERGGPRAGAAARAMFERCAPEDFEPFFRHCLPLYFNRPLTDAAARAARSRPSWKVNRYFFGPDGEAWRMDLSADVAAVRCPALVIAGVDDPLAPPEVGRAIVAGAPNWTGELALFEGSSHAVLTDEPDRFVATAVEFIERVSRSHRDT
jgi:proline iminopeptidase